MSKIVVDRRKFRKKVVFVAIALIFIILCIALGIKVASNYHNQTEIGENNIVRIEEKNETVPKDTTINFVAIGDIMCHKTNFKVAYDSKTKTYDFSPVFTNVAKYITKADIAIRKFGNNLCRRSKRI